MLRRRDLMGSKGGGNGVYHWDYTMGSPLNFGWVADITEGQAEMQENGFFLSASSTTAFVKSNIKLSTVDLCRDFEIGNGFEIEVLFKIVNDNGFSELLRMEVYDKNNIVEWARLMTSNDRLQINTYNTGVTVTLPSNKEVTQKFVMKDGKLSTYYNEYAYENVKPVGGTEGAFILLTVSNNQYNKGTSSVLIERIDITLNTSTSH